MTTVAEILKSKADPTVYTVGAEVSVFEALGLMAQKNIGALVVVEHQACAAVPSRYQVSHGRVPVMRAAQAFAVHGNQLPRQRGTQLLHPADEVGFETLRLQQRKDPAEGVVRGNPVVKGQEPPQPIHLEPRPLHHAHPVVGSTGHATQCHQQQLIQRVWAVAAPRAFQFLKGFQKSGACILVFSVHQFLSNAILKRLSVSRIWGLASCNRPG